jgi:LPS O-antigen subunit length determinant protein (WzzB/FepE family)
LGLAEMIATGVNSGAEYTQRAKDVDRTSEALADAKKELALLESRSSANTTMTIDQKFLQTKLDSLNSQLETLKEKQDTLAARAEGNDAETTYMVTAAALSDAKSELGDLEVKLGYDSVLQNTEYKVAQDKVDQLNLTIGDLTKQLGSLVGETTDSSEITGYLVAGKPLKPTPVVPERPKASKILMTGAIVGVLLGWIILNIKWIAKGMPSNKPRDEEDIAPPTETSGQAN